MELVDDADRDKNGKIDFEEWEIMGTPNTLFLRIDSNDCVSSIKD